MITQTLNDDLKRVFQQIQETEVTVGEEHSRYVDTQFTQLIQRGDCDEAAVQSIFMDEGRFHGKMKFSQFLEGKGPVDGIPGFNFPKSLLNDDRIFDLRCFAGRRGYSSSLHFDWNSLGVYIINVMGKKTFRLFSPKRSSELQGYSNFYLGTPPVADQEVTLKEGDTLYIPPFWWHQAIYETTACSFSLRFGGEDVLFWKKHIYPSWKLVEAFHERPEELHHFARKLYLIDNLDQKFSLIESKTHHEISRDPKYEMWAKGYLAYMKRELTQRLIVR